MCRGAVKQEKRCGKTKKNGAVGVRAGSTCGGRTSTHQLVSYARVILSSERDAGLGKHQHTRLEKKTGRMPSRKQSHTSVRAQRPAGKRSGDRRERRKQVGQVKRSKRISNLPSGTADVCGVSRDGLKHKKTARECSPNRSIPHRH